MCSISVLSGHFHVAHMLFYGFNLGLHGLSGNLSYFLFLVQCRA